MFGYVLPVRESLARKDWDMFQGAYCGLCHTLGRRYGVVPRLFLNYDMTFLALLLQPRGERKNCRCFLHPLRGRQCACRDAALDLSADLSVILLWWQVQDSIIDYKGLRRFSARLTALLLQGAYRKAAAAQPVFNESVQKQLAALAKLERAHCPSLDEAADCFARLLQSAAVAAQSDGARRRILEQELYHLGRWIYLVDAADDLKKDLRQGNYNPLLYRFHLENGALSQADRDALGRTLDASVRQIAAAFELDEPGEYRAVVESVIYEGLYLVGGAVLDGSFHRRRRGKAFNPNGKAGSAHG